MLRMAEFPVCDHVGSQYEDEGLKFGVELNERWLNVRGVRRPVPVLKSQNC